MGLTLPILDPDPWPWPDPVLHRVVSGIGVAAFEVEREGGAELCMALRLPLPDGSIVGALTPHEPLLAASIAIAVARDPGLCALRAAARGLLVEQLRAEVAALFANQLLLARLVRGNSVFFDVEKSLLERLGPAVDNLISRLGQLPQEPSR